MMITRPVESHSGARGNILVGPPNIFAIRGAPLGKFFFEFFFSKCCILVYFCISERRLGPPNVAGPGVAYPLPHPLDGPGDHHRHTVAQACVNGDRLTEADPGIGERVAGLFLFPPFPFLSFPCFPFPFHFSFSFPFPSLYPSPFSFLFFSFFLSLEVGPLKSARGSGERWLRPGPRLKTNWVHFKAARKPLIIIISNNF